MYRITRQILPVLAVGAALLVVGCAASSSTAAPSATVVIPPSATTAPSATADPTTAPIPTASAAPSTEPSPSAAAVCPVELEGARIVSDRLVDVTIDETGDADVVRFVFGNPSPERPQGPAEVRLEAATPPYTEAASGLPVELNGEHVAQVVFTGMSVMNDIGEPTYDGALEFRPGLSALEDVVNFDMFEGHVSWYLSYDGSGCVRLATDGQDIVATVEHG